MRTKELEAALQYVANKESASQHTLLQYESKRQPISQTVQDILAAEVRRLEADKRRMDWLDKSAVWNARTDVKEWARMVYRGQVGYDYALRAGVREAIDAAMEASK